MNHLKLKMMAGILLVFFMGIAVGAVGTHMYAKHRFEKMVRGPAAFLFPRFMKKIGNELALTPEQQKKAAEIIGDLEEALFEFRKRHAGELDDIIDRHFQMLKTALSPEQQEKLENSKNSFQRLRKRWLEPHDRFGPPRDPDARRLQRTMKDRLNLTDEQWERVRPIVKRDFREKRRLFRRHWREDMDEKDFQERLNAVQADTERKLATLLTPDQMAAFRKMENEFIRRRAGDTPPPPPDEEP